MCSNNVDEVEQSTEGLRSSLSEVTLQLNVDRCTKDVSIPSQNWLSHFWSLLSRSYSLLLFRLLLVVHCSFFVFSFPVICVASWTVS